MRDIDSFCHMNDITDCRTVEYAYRRIIRRHVYRNTHTTVQHTMYILCRHYKNQAMSYSGSTQHDEADLLVTTSASGIFR